ncbi:MAG: hypothetical protein HY862_12170 [Chloroflexi bacterium]|nr:hypothetical protein [Chloroflexota bacterium]
MTNATEGKTRSIKPTLDTPFHIDYQWWEKESQDLRSYLMGLLPEDRRAMLTEQSEMSEIDVIDPQTAEVRKIDPFEQVLRETEIDLTGTSLVDAIFQLFLKNGNRPLTPVELGELTSRPPTTILRTLAGTRVYRGLRPIIE